MIPTEELERIVERAFERATGGSLVGGVQNSVHLHVHLSDDNAVVAALVGLINDGKVAVAISSPRMDGAQVTIQGGATVYAETLQAPGANDA